MKKYNKGDMLNVNKNRHGHSFNIGETVEITHVYEKEDAVMYWCVGCNNGWLYEVSNGKNSYCMKECELEKI